MIRTLNFSIEGMLLLHKKNNQDITSNIFNASSFYVCPEITLWYIHYFRYPLCL